MIKIAVLFLYHRKSCVIQHYIRIILIDEFALCEEFYIIPPILFKFSCGCFIKCQWFRQSYVILIFNNFSQSHLHFTGLFRQGKMCIQFFKPLIKRFMFCYIQKVLCKWSFKELPHLHLPALKQWYNVERGLMSIMVSSGIEIMKGRQI